MNVDELRALFEKDDDEYLQFAMVENPPSKRRDLCAFLLLDKLVPGTSDIVSAAEHDEIWLDVEPEELAKVITEDQVIYLLRCGVRWTENEDLGMYV